MKSRRGILIYSAGQGLSDCLGAWQTTWLYMKRLYKTKPLIFTLLSVLCVQKQPFRFLFYYHPFIDINNDKMDNFMVSFL